MSQPTPDPARRTVVELLAESESALDAQIGHLKKAKTALGGGRRKLEKQPASQKILEKLAADLEKLPDEVKKSASAELSVVAPMVRQRIQDLSANLERDLRKELQQIAGEKNLEFLLVAGTLALGPFALSFDVPKERASLTYATHPVADRVPLDAGKIIAESLGLSESILAPVEKLDQLADDLEQALRVAIVRSGAPQSGIEQRADLPAIYREMVYIRQSPTRPLTKASVREYSLARFIVEVKTLIQSDRNLESAKRFRLETAVLDNTRNKKKSVYIPNDLKKGYGEGMYYQALVLVTQG